MLTAKDARERTAKVKVRKAFRRRKVLDIMQKRTIDFCDNQLTSDLFDSIEQGETEYSILLACGYNQDLSIQSVIPTIDVSQKYFENQWIEEGLSYQVLQEYLNKNGYTVKFSEEEGFNLCYMTISWE